MVYKDLSLHGLLLVRATLSVQYVVLSLWHLYNLD